MKRCKHCGRTVWEQLSGIPTRENEGSGIYYHHHNGSNLCFPNQYAEVDEDNPEQAWPLTEVISSLQVEHYNNTQS